MWRVSMRRYVTSSNTNFPCTVSSYHDAFVLLGEFNEEGMKSLQALEHYHEHSQWPRQCGCGHPYNERDPHQIFTEALYRDQQRGVQYTLRDAPIGAMWYAPWLEKYPNYQGPDGRTLIVRVPDKTATGHDWMIEGRASNCDSPCVHCSQPYHAHKGGECKRYEDARPHKCWVRHGEAPNITVDKNGVTCNAGGGSILTDGWHGFLRNGQLVL
jgi:hypothetical protein